MRSSVSCNLTNFGSSSTEADKGSLRIRSPFSITAIVMAGARVRDGGGAISDVQRLAREHAQRIAVGTLFNPVARIEAVQAMSKLTSIECFLMVAPCLGHGADKQSFWRLSARMGGCQAVCSPFSAFANSSPSS